MFGTCSRATMATKASRPSSPIVRPTGRTGRGALGLGGARPSVAVFDPDHVLELRRGHLDDVAVLESRHAVERARRDVEDVARLHLDPPQVAVLVLGAGLEQQASRLEQDRLVLHAVVLQGEALAL